MRTDSLFTVAAWTADCDGYVHVATLPADAEHAEPRILLHAAPGMPPPDGAEVVVDGSLTPWTVEALAAAHPATARHVLEAEYLDGGELRRCKVADVPAGVTPVVADLVPHTWLGQG